MKKTLEEWEKLYSFQEDVLNFFSNLKQNASIIYFGGGTALARYYLNHRLSEDLDFFGDNIFQFYQESSIISNKIIENYKLKMNMPKDVQEDYTYFYIEQNDIFLKIEMQNYFDKRVGNIHTLTNGLYIDNLENILSNKITTFCNRNEAKDLFDIICISNNYTFNWNDIINISSNKQLETDEYSGTKENFLKTINNFNLKQLDYFIKSYYCLNRRYSYEEFKNKIDTIINDIENKNTNSLSKTNIHIKNATPNDKILIETFEKIENKEAANNLRALIEAENKTKDLEL
jgi:hypothetical protein